MGSSHERVCVTSSFCRCMHTYDEMKTQRPDRNGIRTLRLIFEYEGDKISLISRQSVGMIPPPTTARAVEGQTGFWYELRDGQDRPLYQRVTQNPIHYDSEVFTGEPKESIRRQVVPSPKGTFVLLVPEIPEAESIVLLGAPLSPTAHSRSARELIRFPLRGK